MHFGKICFEPFLGPQGVLQQLFKHKQWMFSDNLSWGLQQHHHQFLHQVLLLSLTVLFLLHFLLLLLLHLLLLLLLLHLSPIWPCCYAPAEVWRSKAEPHCTEVATDTARAVVNIVLIFINIIIHIIVMYFSFEMRYLHFDLFVCVAATSIYQLGLNLSESLVLVILLLSIYSAEVQRYH